MRIWSSCRSRWRKMRGGRGSLNELLANTMTLRDLYKKYHSRVAGRRRYRTAAAQEISCYVAVHSRTYITLTQWQNTRQISSNGHDAEPKLAGTNFRRKLPH